MRVVHLFVRNLVHDCRWRRRQVRSPHSGGDDVPPVSPVVTLKLAQTLDGRIATSTGHSRWVTGMEARSCGHRLRAEHAGVVVGINTVLVDDPRLDVRLVDGPDPVRIVLDSRLRISPSSTVLSVPGARTVVATTHRADHRRVAPLEAMGVQVLRLPDQDDRVSLHALLAWLNDEGMTSLLVEGGAIVTTSFLRERLATHVVIFIAPKILGAGTESIGDLGVTVMSEAITVVDRTVDAAGEDLVIRGRLQWPVPSPHS